MDVLLCNHNYEVSLISYAPNFRKVGEAYCFALVHQYEHLVFLSVTLNCTCFIEMFVEWSSTKHIILVQPLMFLAKG